MLVKCVIFLAGASPPPSLRAWKKPPPRQRFFHPATFDALLLRIYQANVISRIFPQFSPKIEQLQDGRIDQASAAGISAADISTAGEILPGTKLL